MPFQIPILCYDNHVDDFGQTILGADPHAPFGWFMPSIFHIKEAPVSDSTQDVPMTPGVIAQQNEGNDQCRVLNLQGLPLSTPQWGKESSQAPHEEKKKKDEREQSKRRKLAQQQQEERDRLERHEDFDRRYRSYMAVLATEELQSRTKGEPMDPESMISMLHAGMDAMTSGLPSAIHGITAEHAVQGADGDRNQDREKENLPITPMPRPRQDD